MKKILMGLFLSAFIIACNNEKKEEPTGDATVAGTSEKKADAVLLDVSEGDMIKNSFAALSQGDIEGFTANHADTIFYSWSSGDSLVGKKAVQDYWKERWQIIDSISFSEHIVLPVDISKSQSQYAPTGKWILYWTMVDVKYKNAKKLNFWVHSVNHLNADGKVDFVGTYVDRAPILEATKDLMK